MKLSEACIGCEAYQYSKEYYELVKECAELAVMQQYLECQEFASDNEQLSESMNTAFGESYIMECDSADEITALETAITEKANGIWTKVKNGAAKLWKILITAVRKLITNINNGKAAHAKIMKWLTSNPDAIPEAAKLTASIASDYPELALNTNKDISASRNAKISKKLEFDKHKEFSALNGSQRISLVVAALDEGDYVYPTNSNIPSVNQLSKAIDYVSNNKYKEAFKLLNSASNGVAEITLNVGELEKIANKMDEYLKSDQSQAVPSEGNVSDAVACLRLLNTYIADTVKMVGALQNYRVKTLSSLNEFTGNWEKDKKNKANSVVSAPAAGAQPAEA